MNNEFIDGLYKIQYISDNELSAAKGTFWKIGTPYDLDYVFEDNREYFMIDSSNVITNRDTIVLTHTGIVIIMYGTDIADISQDREIPYHMTEEEEFQLSLVMDLNSFSVDIRKILAKLFERVKTLRGWKNDISDIY
jgi:hypothetical protein